MILAPILGASLLVAAAFDSGVDTRPGMSAVPLAPAQTEAQKGNAIRPLIRDATECVAQTVTDDPRARDLIRRDKNVNELIVESMSSCTAPMRRMIEAYDRLYGDGQGEAYFMGPYLDGLPTIVDRLVKSALRDRAGAE